MCTILHVGKLEFESVKKNCVTGNLEKKNNPGLVPWNFTIFWAMGYLLELCSAEIRM